MSYSSDLDDKSWDLLKDNLKPLDGFGGSSNNYDLRSWVGNRNINKFYIF